MQTDQQQLSIMCVIRKVKYPFLQAAPEFIPGGSSALVLHGRNLRASLAMGWQVHVTQNECWQAGHSDPD